MSRPITSLNPYLWKYRHLLVPGLLCTVISAIFWVMIPMVVRQSVDSIPTMVQLAKLHGGTDASGPLFSLFFRTLLTHGVLILGLSLASGICLFVMRQTVVVSSRHIEYDLRNHLYEHIQKLPMSFFQNYSTGDVITRSTSDIEQVRRYVGPALMYAARSLVLLVVALTVMVIISPTLTAYALIPMPFLAVAIFFMSGMVHSRSEAIQGQYSKLTSRVQEAFAGIRVLKAYCREEYEAAEFDKESDKYRKETLGLAAVEAAFQPIFVLLIGASMIIVVWVGGLEFMKGTISIGNIVEYIIYVTILTWPVASLGMVINMVQRADASMGRLLQITETVPTISDSDETDHSIASVSGEVEFRNVTFRYPGEGPEVLKDISFRVAAGSTLGIVGRTGTGKSTLIELVNRVIDPTKGQVLIDGRDARQFPLELLRSSVGCVPQDVFLFSDTVGNNIAFGRMEATPDQINQAALEADLLENVEEFADGFETFVGERGITLSGGQKQRSSIARAVIRDPAILILDDALSAVDTDTEARILGHLRKKYGQRTTIVVSHRISAVQDADLIIVLDDGMISERGNHEDLVETGGIYAELYNKQLLEEEIRQFDLTS